MASLEIHFVALLMIKISFLMKQAKWLRNCLCGLTRNTFCSFIDDKDIIFDETGKVVEELSLWPH